MRKDLLLPLALALPLLAAPPNKAAPRPIAQPMTLDSYRHGFLEAYWSLHPDQAIEVGYYKYAERLPIPDAAQRRQELAFASVWLGNMKAFEDKALALGDRTDLALIRNELEASRWRLTDLKAFEWNPALYNVGPAFGLLLGTEYAPLDTRLRSVSRRLAHVPAYYAAALENLKNPTLEHTELAMLQNQGALGVFGDGFLKQVEGSGLSDPEKDRLRTGAAKARAAIQGYLDHLAALDKELRAHGGRSFRLGKALYEPAFAYEIQADCTAEELYKRAKLAKGTLHARMDELTRKLWPAYFGGEPMPGDRLARIGRMVARLSEQHVAPDQFVAEVKRQIPLLERWVADHKLVDLDPAKPLVVRATPGYMAGVAGASISAPGPYDPKANTYYNVTPLSGSKENMESYLREYNDYTLQILNIHEAVPGHYVQLLHANKAPSLVKAVFGNGAMIEGWAVYAERMMLESGYGGDTPELWLMYSKWNLRVVCNTILDYGVHVLGMTEAQARELLVKEAFQEEAEANEKWHRVQVSSVQLTSYFAGFSALYDLREKLKAKEKGAFNLHDFHEELLSYGSAPVKFTREAMLARQTKPKS